VTLTDFFESLGAPLANGRWSWGAQRVSDGAVFLKVWQDRKMFEGGRQYYLVDRQGDEPDVSRNLGYQERLGHIEAVGRGRSCYLIVCIAADVDARPRKIADFHHEHVFVGGALLQKDHDTWIEAVTKKPVSALAQK
jgi:hypothetical protein